jgi:Uma2 family endonuclease
MSTVTTPLMTAEAFFAWCQRPENRDKHLELERGKVVEVSRPGERHGIVCGNVAWLLGSYLRQRQRGRLCANDTGIIWERDPDTVRGPDCVLYDRGQPFEQASVKYSDEVPQLVVEVLSPKDRWGKVLQRITDYLQRGVQLVWLIDPEGRTASVHLPDQLPRVFEENEEVTGAPPFPDLRCRVAEFFFSPQQ